MGLPDTTILSDLFDLIILNELLRKKLLFYVRKYADSFDKTFDFSKSIPYFDFYSFIRKSGTDTLILDQFLLNLELFIIKYYKLCEIDTRAIKKTKIKSLRQSFAHRTSCDILGNKERVVIFTGFIFNFDTLFVANMSEGAKETKTIEYGYTAYIASLLLLSDSMGVLKAKRNNIRQLKEMNLVYIGRLFPKLKK